jgi:urease beta subunit
MNIGDMFKPIKTHRSFQCGVHFFILNKMTDFDRNVTFGVKQKKKSNVNEREITLRALSLNRKAAAY